MPRTETVLVELDDEKPVEELHKAVNDEDTNRGVYRNVEEVAAAGILAAMDGEQIRDEEVESVYEG